MIRIVHLGSRIPFFTYSGSRGQKGPGFLYHGYLYPDPGFSYFWIRVHNAGKISIQNSG